MGCEAYLKLKTIAELTKSWLDRYDRGELYASDIEKESEIILLAIEEIKAEMRREQTSNQILNGFIV